MRRQRIIISHSLSPRLHQRCLRFLNNPRHHADKHCSRRKRRPGGDIKSGRKTFRGIKCGGGCAREGRTAAGWWGGHNLQKQNYTVGWQCYGMTSADGRSVHETDNGDGGILKHPQRRITLVHCMAYIRDLLFVQEHKATLMAVNS